MLAARNDHGETPKDLAQQFYKDNILEYVSHIEYETDHPEEQESKSFSGKKIVPLREKLLESSSTFEKNLRVFL